MPGAAALSEWIEHTQTGPMAHCSEIDQEDEPKDLHLTILVTSPAWH